MTALQFWFVVAVAWVLLIWFVLAAYRSIKVQRFSHALSKTAQAMIDAGRAITSFSKELSGINEGLTEIFTETKMHFDHHDEDDDNLVAWVNVPKHQLPIGLFVSPVPGELITLIEQEDDEIPLHIRVVAAELLNQRFSCFDWCGNSIDLEWHNAEYMYLLWEFPNQYARLSFSFSSEWFAKELEAMKGEAKDRATEMKRGDK